MKSNRRTFMINMTLGMAGIALSGCLTEKLYQPTSYSEEVSTVLISQDGKKLVFISKRYHYIFDAPEIVVQTLHSPFHAAVSATLHDFVVHADGSVSGKLSLIIMKGKSTEEDKAAALAVGYETTVAGGAHATVELKGMRYSAGDVKVPGTMEQLNQKYQVSLTVEPGPGGKAARVLATPITVAVDGALILTALPLVVVGVGLFVAACSKGHSCH
jgi:hypothetical protein